MKKRLLFTLFALFGIASGASAQEAYAVLSTDATTLTFYFDKNRSKRSGLKFDLNTGKNNPGWYDVREAIKEVVFDDSFKDARPTSTYNWFSNFEVTEIPTITNLNTSEVTDMSGMFRFCSNLTSIDLSHFDTSKVTGMGAMFTGCQSLTSLGLSSFNTSKVQIMFRMFDNCCFLKSLDLSSFDTHEVTDMRSMLNNCQSLQTIYVGSAWNTDKVTRSESMFDNCFQLVGQQGTAYDSNYSDKTYAHIDGGMSNPGYLSEVVTYALEVKGKNVTSANMTDILGDGTVSFDGDKTLTLNNVSFSIDKLNGSGVYNQIPDLEVVVEGDNAIESKQGLAFYTNQNTHFKGTGTLRLKGYSWGLYCVSGATFSTITVSGGIHLICLGGERATAENPNWGGGFSGYLYYRANRYVTTLEVSGANTLIEAKGTGYASSLYNFRKFVLNDGLEVTAPVGAAFDETEHAVCDADGNVVKDEWVVIKGKAPSADVNGDGSVDVADIGMVIDVMAGKAPEYKDAADVNGDTSVDVADIGTIIDVMAGKGVERAYSSCPDTHHPHIIDLGLPSGTKWACCNVGAEKPEDYGNYYACGETTTKSEYTWATYIYCDGTRETCYNLGSDIAGTDYDAATANWKAPWRMPTREQCKELIDNCTSEWTTLNGVNGKKFTGPYGGTIFLPAAGYRDDSDLDYAGSNGYYWSSTVEEDGSGCAWYLGIGSGVTGMYDFYLSFGKSVRPVR